MMKNVSAIIVCLQINFFESCYFGSKVQEYYYRSSIPCALEDLDIRTRDGMSKSSLSKSCLNRDHRICIMKLYWPIQYSRWKIYCRYVCADSLLGGSLVLFRLMEWITLFFGRHRRFGETIYVTIYFCWFRLKS